MSNVPYPTKQGPGGVFYVDHSGDKPTLTTEPPVEAPAVAASEPEPKKAAKPSKATPE